MVFAEPGAFTSVSIEDYVYFGYNSWDIQAVGGQNPTLNGKISVNSTAVEDVTVLKIAAKNFSGDNIATIANIVRGSKIYFEGNYNTPAVTYVAETPADQIGDASYSLYQVNVSVFEIFNDDPWSNGSIYDFNIINPLNIVIPRGYEKYEISYESNISGSPLGGVTAPIRLIVSGGSNVGDLSMVEFRGVSTNGEFNQYADLQYGTISGSLEENSKYISLNNTFDTGSGFLTFQVAQSGSNIGFMLLGYNEYN
tara:strand:- start:10 stop:768 length:759 start_codon:yes stop_codon:yes gene_type:complete